VTRVLVIGAGPAGLAAAARLLEKGKGKVQVQLVHMGHHLGGKAASYRSDDGRFVEHGWHMVLGFYKRMRSLLARAGVDERQAFRSMGRTSYPYEPTTGRIHSLPAARTRADFLAQFAFEYDGLAGGDKANYASFMLQTYLRVLSDEPLTPYDDLCFNTWAIEHGLRPHLTRTSVVRLSRDGYFNFPEQISAYHMLQSMRLIDSPDSGEQFVCTGPYSEKVWEPLGQYLQRLGAAIEPFTMATDWLWEGRRIVGVKVSRPDSAGHHDGRTSWQEPAIPKAPGTEQVLRDFDFVVSTIPHAVFIKMNAQDARMWRSPYFSRLLNLRSAATVSMTLISSEPGLLPYRGPVFGFPAPLGIAINMTVYWQEYRQNPNVRSAIAFVGQEAGFEAWTDQEIIDFTLDNFSKGVGDLRRGTFSVELHRNRSDFERLLLCEPGVNQFRPGPLTPFTNLFLAGDWVRNDVDLICMEGAMASGEAAADLVLARA